MLHLARTAVAILAPSGGPGRRALSRLGLAGLGLLLPRLLRRRHLAELLDELGGASPAPPSGEGRRVLDALRRWPTTCLWRALAGYAALRARGEAVRFVVGVRAAEGEVVAHAWLEVEGAPLGEREDPRARFAVAYVHPPPAGTAARAVREVTDVSAFAPKEDVILTELRDGTGVLLHLATKFYYSLNATGVAVWKLLASGAARTPAALASALSERFAGVAPEEARGDVDRLLAELVREELVAGPEEVSRA